MDSRMQLAVESILAKALAHVGGSRPAEFKSLTVTPLRGRRGDDLFIQMETGMVDDDGTLASVFCRSYGSFVVTPRGTVRAAHTSRGNVANARRFPLIYGFVTSLGKSVPVGRK